MKGSFLSDVKEAVNVFRGIRKARKCGADGVRIDAVPLKGLPRAQSCAFYSTVEGCALSRIDKEIRDKAQDAFHGLPYEEQHRMTFSPKDGEFLERAQFWRSLLEPVITAEQRRKAMIMIIGRYVYIKKLRLNGTV